ncbi:DUF1572 domain-containing protein [uncultured Mucilaginibacter sp.]|uniref:DUF1572 domain-containing protein n=1 Tax=uncultured Mucilaginibacter sp. TaxID=797541 RepID=UPI0025CB8166|nr:DUF1572 domain-containing protein [uncultured Mucilaginibacter sp.]
MKQIFKVLSFGEDLGEAFMKTYLTSVIKRFEYYKTLAEQTLGQVNDEGLFWQYNEESNSIAMIVQHLAGNMLSRWTDFLTSDGEKDWRNRDAEFETVITNRAELLIQWNKGWDCLFNALNSIGEDDWDKDIYIRNERHSVVDAINRQLAHYPYHVGQIVFIGKMIDGADWNSLSIPKGKSGSFNSEKFKKQ